MNHDTFAPAFQRFIDQFMIMAAAITRRRIDEVDAEIERPMQRGNRLVIIRRSVRARHAHAAESKMRNFELRRAELNVFHDSSVRSRQLPQLKLASQSVRSEERRVGKECRS